MALGCASPATRIPVSEIPRPTPPLILPPFQMDSTLTPDRVPAFRPLPLIVWGPPPAGVSHRERTRSYDLQHQATTIRFDWPRQAVVGTTTLRIAGLPGATPLSSISIEGDRTFKGSSRARRPSTTTMAVSSSCISRRRFAPARRLRSPSITMAPTGRRVRTSGPRGTSSGPRAKPRTPASGFLPTISQTTRRPGNSTSGPRRASAPSRTGSSQDPEPWATASSGTGCSTSRRLPI